MPELILILAIALIVIGPKKLPDLAKSLGRAMREFKKATNEFKESIQIDEDLTDVKRTFDDFSEDIKDSVSPEAKPDLKRIDESEAAGDKTDAHPPETEGDDKIENMNKTVDELKAPDSAPSDKEHRAKSEKKEKRKGPGENDG
jgi:TatA/E family protein of Tat protein translocase